MIIRPNSTEVFARTNAGGKGLNLYYMSQQNLPVPEWRIIGANVFSDFLQISNMKTKIDTIITKFKNKEISISQTQTEIENMILGAEFPESIERSIQTAYNELGTNYISVRSSAVDEDSGKFSFAGQLVSYLYVDSFEATKNFVKKCWASSFHERVLKYRIENNLEIVSEGIAVVLQKMIFPESSGVAFTCDPIQNNLDRFLVSSVYGVGEGLVSGELDSDNFWLDRLSAKVLSSEVANKEFMLSKGVSGETSKLAVESSLQNIASLNEQQLSQLHKILTNIYTYYGSPQDVEWAYSEGEFYILQSRPVTSFNKDYTGYINLWDNSNIIESYGGLTKPLTFTFALYAYKSVYIQFCEILMVPQKVVKDMDYYLRNMLGCINGRVFYNLYNWYKLVGILPGFKQNRRFMETMMGVSEEITDEVKERIKPHDSEDSFKGKARRLITGFKFFYYHLTIDSMVRDFLSYFKSHYDHFRKIDFRKMSGDMVFLEYLKMDRVMLSQWKAPIINDFLCMVHFGLLKKLTDSWLPTDNNSLQNDLISGEGGLESAEPTKELIRMAGLAKLNPEIETIVLTAPTQEQFEIFHQSEFTEFKQKVYEYIDRFGFRCMSEMKLEETDLSMDPSFMFVALKNLLKNNITNIEEHEKSESRLRTKAETYVKANLSGLKKIFYLWVLKHARKAVKNRENTRFARTRAYGIVRSMFHAIGADLARRGIIKTEKDIFYITLEELYGVFQGTLPSCDLLALIDIRKKSYQTYEDLEPKARFTSRGPVYWMNEFLEVEEAPESDPNGEYDLKGIPCCPGLIEGEVKVILDPKDDLNLDGHILVARRTDPGWVPLFPSASALLVERGSLLSHSAVVAREMGIPAIVGIKGLTTSLKTGMKVRMNGKDGTIQILKNDRL